MAGKSEPPSTSENSTSMISRNKFKPPIFNDDIVVLYMHPYNFHSQKVMLVLYEKNITFETYALDLCNGEQYSSWFLSLNPKGDVPVLQVGPFVIPESTNIIEYIEDKYQKDGRLQLKIRNCANEDTDKMLFFDRLFSQVPVGAISLGSFMHDDLNLVSKPPFIGPARKSCISKNEKVYEILKKSIEDSATQNKSVLLCKLNLQDRRRELVSSRHGFQKVLDRVAHVLYVVEENLKNNPNRKWLISNEYTLADVNLGMLLHRLFQLGFDDYYWTGKMPHVENYFLQFKKRNAYQKLIPKNIDILKDMWEKTPSGYKIGAGVLGMAMFAALSHK